MSVFLRLALVAAIVVSILAPAPLAGARPSTDPISGRWDAALVIPSGDVPFGLDLKLHGGAVSGAVLNGPERQAFSTGTFDGATLTLRMDYYDGTITAKLEGGKLAGEYKRQTRAGIGTYVFHAERRGSTTADRFDVKDSASPALGLSGDWVLTLVKTDGTIEEVDDATFTTHGVAADRASVTGTVIPVSGDYGLLAGEIAPGPSSSGEKRPRFRLSRFDGIHVTLLTGEVAADGTLSGELASGLSYRVRFTGVRKGSVAATNGASPGDPFAMTTVKNPAEPFAFTLPDVAGKPVSLSDERFRGKVVVVDIFGTWCPNCHDETPFLVDLYKKYQKDGLEIVALAYEYTPDNTRNVRQVDIFRRKYGIEFPILLAGTTNDGEIARTLPQLVNFGAYPTTIFVGRDGRVRKIHAGFSGPATGERFPAVKKEMEALVRELLAERPS